MHHGSIAGPDFAHHLPARRIEQQHPFPIGPDNPNGDCLFHASYASNAATRWLAKACGTKPGRCSA